VDEHAQVSDSENENFVDYYYGLKLQMIYTSDI